MGNTDRDSMLERWADGMEKLEQYYEGKYGPPATPATLPNITDTNGMLAAIADGLERARININKHSTTYHDTNTAYSKTVPANTKNASIELVGGKTIVWNQNAPYVPTGADNGSYSTDADGVTSYTFDSIKANSYGNCVKFGSLSVESNGHKFYVSCEYYSSKACTPNVWLNGTGGNTSMTFVEIPVNTWTKCSKVGNTQSAQPLITTYNICFGNPNGKFDVGDTVKIRNPMLIDLTVMFGAGNEPKTAAEFEALFPATYYYQNARELLSAGVTSVISKNSNETIDTYDVPASVKALTGYGWSCPNHYNYIDFVTKNFVQEVGSRVYASGDESDSTVITDGTNTYYALNAPVETDISAYITDDIRIEVEPGGTLTFQNQYGDDYRVPVPSTETFWVDIS